MPLCHGDALERFQNTSAGDSWGYLMIVTYCNRWMVPTMVEVVSDKLECHLFYMNLELLPSFSSIVFK